MQTEALWFLDTLVRFPVARPDAVDGPSVLESVARRGDSPPLHVHRAEDEIFHVIEGQVTLRVGEREVEARAGDTMLAPRGVPHTYRVDSSTARFLAITAGGAFERFVRGLARPAEHSGPPETSGPPTPEAQRELAAAAAAHGIEIVGPPLR